MKIVQMTGTGGRRERLLRGYFFNAFLIAALKQAMCRRGQVHPAAAARVSKREAAA